LRSAQGRAINYWKWICPSDDRHKKQTVLICPDVALIEWPKDTALIGDGSTDAGAAENAKAAGQQGAGERWPAVILQRP
jgi:hypothetical protein